MSADKLDFHLTSAKFALIKAILVTMLRESEEMSAEVRKQLSLLAVVDNETTKPLDPETDPTSFHLQNEIKDFLTVLGAMEAKRNP
ncbi:MAG: hypothetical protein OXL96_28760 [Candidatus Poribacteria bacterium]|nr:hypothetical protein [Candidatus Poribacteria bacterium]